MTCLERSTHRTPIFFIVTITGPMAVFLTVNRSSFLGVIVGYLTLILLVANIANTNLCKKSEK